MNALEFEFDTDPSDSSALDLRNAMRKRGLDRIQDFYPITIRRQLWIICEPP